MKKHNIKYLILALVTITLSLTFLIYEAILVRNELEFVYSLNRNINALDYLLTNLSLLYIIMVGAFALSTAIGTLPFTVILFRREGKKWFTILLLVLSILLIVLPILTYISMPVITSLNPIPAASSSTSAPTTSSI